MAEGRIKDPDGKQAAPYWGYIQRTDCVNWADTLLPKVIPFFNPGNFKFGDLVEFEIANPTFTTNIIVNGKQVQVTAEIGVADNVRLKT